jgi:hypothetical protein
MHVPSQPLMQSLLSQIQTPTAPRRVSRFFRVWPPRELPRVADHSAYFGLAKFYLSQPFQPSTRATLNICWNLVNARNWCNVEKLVTKYPASNPLSQLLLLRPDEFFLYFPQMFHRGVHPEIHRKNQRYGLTASKFSRIL